MRWALDLARAITYMHQSDPPVVHRDLRPANLLLSSASAIKVTGFGSALLLSPSWSPKTRLCPLLNSRRVWTGLLFRGDVFSAAAVI